MKVITLRKDLSDTTAQLELTKGELTSLKEEHKLLKEANLTVLQKEDEALIEKQSDIKLKVMYNVNYLLYCVVGTIKAHKKTSPKN